MFRRAILIVFVLFLLVCGSLFAQQNAQELRFGSIVSGNIRADEEIWYRIRTTENCYLMIETSGNLDTYLDFYDSQENHITGSEYGGEGNNARIEILAPAGSTYFVLLYSYDTGPFRIISSYTPLTDAVELRAGSSLSGNLNYGQRLIYTVRTTQAGLYTVETTGSLDTYLEAYDSSYDYISYDDDGGDDYNARLEIIAEANKTYYFIMSGYDDSETGPYRIFTSFESVNVGNNTSRSTAAALRLGEATPVFLTAKDQSRWYVYQVPRAVTFIIQTRGNIDTMLYLYDNQGMLIVENDDSEEGDYNAYISTRLNTGTYYIEVKTYGGRIGRCTLHAEIR